MDNIILFADSARGIYIPQHFAESVQCDLVTGIDNEQWDILLSGPEHELYWSVWDEVMDYVTIESKDGKEYTLHQDGDLWLVCLASMTPEEKRNMFDEEIYGRNEPVSVLADVPAWIDQDATLGDVEAIQQGGCASGAYMPAVTYYQARETMNEHGDAVLDYIQDNLGELPAPKDCESWGGIAVHYLSIAVELWAGSIDVEELEG